MNFLCKLLSANFDSNLPVLLSAIPSLDYGVIFYWALSSFLSSSEFRSLGILERVSWLIPQQIFLGFLNSNCHIFGSGIILVDEEVGVLVYHTYVLGYSVFTGNLYG